MKMICSEIASIPIPSRLCFNWLPPYRYALILNQALQQICSGRVSRLPIGVEFTPSGSAVDRYPTSHVRPIIMDAVLNTDGHSGYLIDQFEDKLTPFKNGRKFYPLTSEIALLAVKENDGSQLLNVVMPYTTPAPTTLEAITAVAGGFAGVGEAELRRSHLERKAAAEDLRKDIAALYKVENLDTVLIHPAAVGGIIEATTRYLHTNTPGFTSCLLAPEYWDLFRFLITYSSKGLRLVKGRDEENFPTDAWLTEIARKDLDFAYLSYTSNPVGNAIERQTLSNALEVISDDTLFLIDCVSVDTEQRSNFTELSEILKSYPRKNLLITKSFSKDYDVGHLRLGYALCTRPEMAKALWPYMASYPAANISRVGQRCLREGSAKIIERYKLANNMLLNYAKQYPEVRVTGGFSNYSIVFFKDEIAALAMKERLLQAYDSQIYPNELPMQGGGDLGLNDGEIDLTSIRSVPFLAKNALRLVVTPEAVEAFFKVLR